MANCSQIVGAINVSLVWVSEGGTGQLTVPPTMYHPTKTITWTRNPAHTDQQAWNEFASPAYFDLTNQDGSPAPLDFKSIYFLPACNWTNPIGTTGGTFFGVMAEIPVLVK